MIIAAIIFAVIVLVAIIYLQGHVSGNKMTREEFSTKLESFLGAKKQPIEGYENSYKIEFDFEGNKYIYEDMQVLGFKGNVQKVHLKYQMNNNYTLSFMEKEIGGAVRSDILIMSDLPKNIKEDRPKVLLPASLNMFRVHTNDIALTNKILADKKVESILLSFKNVDTHGRPFMSLNIIYGTIGLHFHESTLFKPNLQSLQNELSTLEEYIDKITLIANKINS